MADCQIERALSRAGILLVLLALVTGLAIPAFTNPRQALAAHVSGIMSGAMAGGVRPGASGLPGHRAYRGTWPCRLRPTSQRGDVACATEAG